MRAADWRRGWPPRGWLEPRAVNGARGWQGKCSEVGAALIMCMSALSQVCPPATRGATTAPDARSNLRLLRRPSIGLTAERST